uniref:hypothetical protein n=1 Tax=Rugamonas fusca TaxID=2758568 RepID=UPI0035CCD08F
MLYSFFNLDQVFDFLLGIDAAELQPAPLPWTHGDGGLALELALPPQAGTLSERGTDLDDDARVARQQGHGPTVPGKFDRRRPAHAGRGPGDHHDFLAHGWFLPAQPNIAQATPAHLTAPAALPQLPHPGYRVRHRHGAAYPCARLHFNMRDAHCCSSLRLAFSDGG